MERLRANQPGLKLAQIARGIYLNVTDLSPSVTPWELRGLVTIARAYAIKMMLGSKVFTVFTGESGGVLLGLDTWWNNPNIAYRADVRRRRKRTLRAVTINGITVPAVSAYHVTGGMTLDPQKCRNRSGITVGSPALLVADTARREHPLQAFVLACSTLTALVGSNGRNTARLRAAAERIRSDWLLKASALAGGRACRIFRMVVQNMEASIDSPLESAALWSVRCLLAPRKRKEVTNQYLVRVPSGAHYFLDLAFPGVNAGLETDGQGKYGKSTDQIFAYAANHTNRHQEISDAGWTLRHVSSRQISDPKMVNIIYQHLQFLGVFPPNKEAKPTGPLYGRPNAELHSRSRRF